MTWRTLIAKPLLLLLAMTCAFPVPHARGAAKETVFDLQERKRKQAWLWETPRKQSPPPVKTAQWPNSAVDRFILQRLEAAGIQPAPETDDRTWLRRAHFVITGLPPRLDEIEAFLSDKTPGARERAVTRLIDSPHFGERWARHWMDLMRYAESRGHESDYIIANAYHYRDYLIRAFNQDIPYNQFLLEHLAGDTLETPRLRPDTEINESVLATGWAYLGEENHSPVDIRQDECERIDNKIDVFSKSFMGLTVSCARCHDHKFDPISTQDYYSMSGFVLGSSFRQVRFEAMVNNHKRAVELESLRAQTLPELTAALASSREAGIRRVASQLLAAREALLSTKPANSNAIARLQPWLTQLSEARTNRFHPLHAFALIPASKGAGMPTTETNANTTTVTLPSDAKIIADFTRPGQLPWKVDGEAFGTRPLVAGDFLLAPRSTNSPILRVMPYGAARRDLFWNRLKSAPGNENDSGRLAATARAGQMIRTPTVTLGCGTLHYLIRGKTHVYAAVDSHIMLDGPLHGQLTATFTGGADGIPTWVTHDLSAYSGHRTHLEFGPSGEGDFELLLVVESPKVPTWRPIPPSLDVDLAQSKTPKAWANAFQRTLAESNQRLKQRSIASSPKPELTAALVNWMLQNPELFSPPKENATEAVASRFLKAQDDLAGRVQWESRTAVSWFDGTGVDENILVRGKPFKPGALSPRSLPAAFDAAKPIQSTASSGRRELAMQLIDPSNPLVARTLVNRVWHHVFGRGIVASVDNFGALGDRPTHPELLDHLAWQFVHEDNWSLKRLIKHLVLTKTFAMTSRVGDARTEELDPSNTLLHRMPIRRLEGEVIRDALLTVSGRLDPKVGGPPVPVHLTEFLVGRGRPDKSGPLDGEGRRSLYTAMRRNFLPTLMQTFDSPTPFSTQGKRNITNVPAQSLALMNDPIFHEQARVWAQRMLKTLPTAEEPRRVEWLFETAYGRKATPKEIVSCVDSLHELRQMEPESEARDLNAWSDLCHALLNSNDFIYLK